MNILLIDNYDSFVYNLHHALSGVDDVNIVVMRNDDENLLTRVAANEFDGVVIGPGPGSPDDKSYFGQCMQIINEYGGGGLPVLGICLGFQGIALAFGMKLKRAAVPVHGKLSPLSIQQGSILLESVSDGSEVMRYHSIMVDTDHGFADDLQIIAEVANCENSVATNGREIMAFEHKSLPIYGVQFHPESYYTPSGNIIMNNFASAVARRQGFSKDSTINGTL